MSFQQLTEEPRGSPPIASGLDQEINHVAVLVNGPPHILVRALNVYEQFVQVPCVANPSAVAGACERTPDRRFGTTAESSRRTR